MSTEMQQLLNIMQALRDPKTGCPWDVQQNFKSIAPYTIEEAYEVADAIERGDLGDLNDELGDLLLQVVFHAQMAKEQDAFEFKDVVNSICDKMTRRHPHVFGNEQVGTAEEQSRNWEKLKAQERAEKDPNKQSSLLDSVTANLPSLKRAQKLTETAAKVGFDWPDANSVFNKLDEERVELEEAIQSAKQEAIFEEFGDLLFVMTNLARKLGIDSDASLRAANQKFIQRFQFIESELIKADSSLDKASLEQMDALWEKAKFEHG